MMHPALRADLARLLVKLDALFADPPPPPATDLLAGQIGPTLRSVARAACAAWDVTLPQLLSERRDAALVEARQAAWLLARELTTASLPAIGRAFRRDHSTVLHGLRRAAARLAAPDPEFRARLAAARALVPLPPTQES